MAPFLGGGEVLAGWQYYAHLQDNIPVDKRVLRISLDETSIAYWDTKKSAGNVFVGKRKRDLTRVLARGGATLRDLRIHLTHVAVVCDDPDVQRRLPQILIIAGAVLPLYLCDDIAAVLPANVEVWRAKSGWVNTAVFVKIIERLGEALASLHATHQCIVLLDCMGAHYAYPVLRAARRCGLWLAFVPASLTWLVQVLDTHAFAQFKEYLRDHYLRARMDAPNGTVPIPAWVGVICKGIQDVLEVREWAGAFDENGFGRALDIVRPRIWAHIGGAVAAVSTEVPAPDQLGLVFPTGRSFPSVEDLFHFAAGAAAGALPVRRRITLVGLR